MQENTTLNIYIKLFFFSYFQPNICSFYTYKESLKSENLIHIMAN